MLGEFCFDFYWELLVTFGNFYFCHDKLLFCKATGRTWPDPGVQTLEPTPDISLQSTLMKAHLFIVMVFV